jgi:hypothetical protein
MDPWGWSKTDKLYGLGKKLLKWAHRKEKGEGDPDFNKKELRELEKEWDRLGNPGPDNKRKWRKDERGFIDPDLLLLLLSLLPLVDELIHPDKIYTDPCEMPGGPPCGDNDVHAKPPNPPKRLCSRRKC